MQRSQESGQTHMPLSQRVAQMLSLQTPSPITRFTPDWAGADMVSIDIKRDDLIHPIISGNKWRKLKYTLDALPASCRHIISFGGGYSNHLHACGYLCSQTDMRFTAIIRGDYRLSPSPMIADLQRWGADIVYVNKLTYQRRTDDDYLQQLQHQYPDAVIIPEGGSQQHALAGVAEILSEQQTHYDHVLVPVGSGATLAGLITALKPQQTATGIAVLKGEGYLEYLVNNLLSANRADTSWVIDHRFHGGGYGKSNKEIAALCEAVHTGYGIPIEPVYSGKLFLALKHMLAEGHFTKGSRLMVVHTGGLQGKRKV